MEVKLHPQLGELGLFTAKQYKQGDIIFTLKGKIFDKPTRESIYVGDNVHVHDEHGQYINHSFTPSTIIQGYNVVACRDLEAGEEITFDYNANEISMAAPFYADGKFVSGKSIEAQQ